MNPTPAVLALVERIRSYFGQTPSAPTEDPLLTAIAPHLEAIRGEGHHPDKDRMDTLQELIDCAMHGTDGVLIGGNGRVISNPPNIRAAIDTIDEATEPT